MTGFSLSATVRQLKGEDMRGSGILPAVVYGAGGESVSLSFSQADFVKMYQQAGDSSLIDLVIDGKEAGKVLVQDTQRDPITGRIIHVDLRRVAMDKVMRAPVTLNFIGLAPAVKEAGGTLVRSLTEVVVECLPKDLVSHIDVDLAVLKTFNDVIKVKNLILTAGLKIVSPHPEDLVAKAMPAITEEEIKAMEEAGKQADVSKIELAGKKPEAEEGEEGAEAVAEGGEKKEAKKEEKK